jgi:hypothetical protein
MRVSIIDVSAAVLVAVVLLLPGREPHLREVYRGAAAEDLRELALQQGTLVERPGDGAAADQLAAVLGRLGQSDWAVRVAGHAARVASPTRWRALLALSAAHADRVEVREAHAAAQAALAACDAPGADCPAHERVRMAVYFQQLDKGLRSGIDPRVEPERFRRYVSTAVPRATVRGAPQQ